MKNKTNIIETILKEFRNKFVVRAGTKKVRRVGHYATQIMQLIQPEIQKVRQEKI